MTPAEWLRAAMTQRWWDLPPAHTRVALTLVAMAEQAGDHMRVVTTYDDLAARCKVPRTSLRRALDSLRDVEFCDFDACPGRGGRTTIHVHADHVSGSFNDHGIVDDSGKNVLRSELFTDHERIFYSGDSGPLNSPLIPDVYERKRGVGGSLVGANPDLLQAITVASSRASDLISDPDLLPESGSRSPTSRDLRRSEIQKSQHSDPGSQPDEDGMTDEPDEPGRPKGQRRIDPDKVPPRAWAAADYLRSQVLAQNAASFLGTKPWSVTAKTGDRLRWANSFRLLHDRLLKALRNADPKASAETAWDEIARSVHWLFNGQPPGGPQFVVHSPEALREKWERITTARRNRAAAAPLGANGRPENMARRQWKSGDDWGNK